MPESSRCAGSLARLRGERVAAVRLQQRPRCRQPRPARAPATTPRRSAAAAASGTRRRSRSCRARTRARSARPRARARPAASGKRSRSSSRVAQLVLRVEVGEEVADRDARRRPSRRGATSASACSSAVSVERLRSRRPSSSIRSATPRQSGRCTSGVGLRQREVVVVLAVDALDERDVLEALRRQVDDARARRVSTALMPIVVPTTTNVDVRGVELGAPPARRRRVLDRVVRVRTAPSPGTSARSPRRPRRDP